jgi:CubicO group peptidase (beta-lactamase class C family)
MTALKLAWEGKLSLFDGIGATIDAPEDKRGITLIELLTHTGGLNAHVMLRERIREPAEAVGHILSLPLVRAPGTDVVYSCLGYIVLGEILERAGGATLDRLAAKYVFEPLGMSRTGFNPKGEDIASTERDDAGVALTGTVHDENARFLGGLAGNAGLFSTAGDVAKFAAMLASGGMHEGREYLPPALYALAVRNHTPGMAESRGLGFSIADGRPLSCGEFFPLGTFGHTGYTGTSFWVDAESGLYAVLLTNAVHFGRNREAFFRARRIFHNIVITEFHQ